MSPTIFRLLCRYNNLYDMPGSVATGQERFHRSVRPSVNSINYGVFKKDDKTINLPMRPRHGCRSDDPWDAPHPVGAILVP